MIIIAEEDGEVVPRTNIGGVEGCRLRCVYVTLKSGWIAPSVDFIEIFGEAPDGSEAYEKKQS
jgi:hypothetical protein